MGWRQWRPPISWLCLLNHGWGVLIETMLQLPVIRWGEPYESLEVDAVGHFSTAEPIAKVSRANGGLGQRDMRQAHRARDVLRDIPIDTLIQAAGKAGELYMNSTLPMGDGTKTADAFVLAQSVATGLRAPMARAGVTEHAL